MFKTIFSVAVRNVDELVVPAGKTTEHKVYANPTKRSVTTEKPGFTSNKS